MEYAKPKTVVAMHDLCGHGRASLTAIYPVLAALNVQVCPLPTAILSHHLGFSTTPSFHNLSQEIKSFIPCWRQEEFSFDAFFSGYLADPSQVQLAFEFIEEFHPSWVYVDPVLGDCGKLYSGFGKEQVDAIRSLTKRANAISPNITEACFLLNHPIVSHISSKEAREMLGALSDFGPRYVSITGVLDDLEKNISVFAMDRDTNQFFVASSPAFPGVFSGAGDAFSSAVLGNLMNGVSFIDSIDRAMTYLYKSLKLAVQYGTEICLEPTLPLLMKGSQNSKIQRFTGGENDYSK